jgi:hypothetical protein
MLARRIALLFVSALLVATTAGGCGGSGSGVASNSVGTGGSAGGSDAGVEVSSGGGPAGCTDNIKNGSETDVDCGGSCPACHRGQACGQDGDCGTHVCHQSQCCSTSTYTKTTGGISGVATVCCDGNDVRTDVSDCASGANHYANPKDPNCAEAGEGANNGGDACALITCEKFDCSAAPVDAGMN